MQQGGRVARAYTLSVRDPQAGSGDRPSHLEWDAAEQKVVLNEGRFRVLDQVLATARELGVRIILPLIDQWDWVGVRGVVVDVVLMSGLNPWHLH